jgi:hypothetical protein
MPGGDLMPHMSARARTNMIDALFAGTGGFDRALAWIEKNDDNYGEFFTKVWARGAAKTNSTELTGTVTVENLLDQLDDAERAEPTTITIVPESVDGGDES